MSSFYVGLAALQVGDDTRADEKLRRATELAPGEPAAWADWGLLALRRKQFDEASERFSKANALAPDNAQIHVLLALLESNRGKYEQAIAQLRRAVELDPRDLKALYMLAGEVERAGGDDNEAEAQSLLQKILDLRPDNLAVLLDVTRLAAKRGDAGALQTAVARLSANAPAWPTEAKEQFAAVRTAAGGTDIRGAATRVAFLRNVLVRVPEYRESLDAVKTPPEFFSEPLTRFLRLAAPRSAPAPPDESLAFTPENLPDAEAGKWDWSGSIYLSNAETPALIYANGREVQATGNINAAFPGGPSARPPFAHSILALDLNNDFRNDLALAGAGGLRLHRQESDGSLTEVTAQTALPASVLNGSYRGVWTADIEADGDLDIVLAPDESSPLVLQNNGDGTFKELHPFDTKSQIRDFAWADLDDDGDPDAIMLDVNGRLLVYSNERAGQFRARAMPPNDASIRAISVADINGDGVLDVIALQANGSIQRFWDKGDGQSWETAEVARLPSSFNYPATDEGVQLLIADLDNNGGPDVLLSTSGNTLAWLGDGQGGFNSLPNPIAARVCSIAELSGDGRLDLIGLAMNKQPQRLVNHGAKNYHWQVLRPRAQETQGDQRINSFGIGGLIEIRAGLLAQRQVIDGPLQHFGLGEQEQTDVARIIWPNGLPDAVFELQADQTVLARQSLKGSCPSLFAFDGKEMSFVKDCAPWSPAIGLRINAYQTASVTQTEEWVKIRGDQLAPRDGLYDLRITAELWETYYLDHYSLLVVDHPRGTEVFADERTARTPPRLMVYTVETPHTFASAQDDRGTDVLGVVRERDGNYLDTFGRGTHQGITRDHFVELELGEDAPRNGPLYLIAHGWLHPTDASVNVAISQDSRREPPQDLRLEVPDGKGHWVVARPSLGFPSGKNKTILIDLDGVFRPGAPRRVRLRTNMEIYWDALEWAAGRPDALLKTERLQPETAELRYRGFSQITQANKSSPELPDYDRVVDTTQRWRDLTGYYTRYGDVRALLSEVDDRYVITNAGDELLLHFKAMPPVAEGFVRDYVLTGNGWIKDGDYNSMFSQTVLPLPSRDRSSYTELPARLEDDPVYQRHAQDWQDYHTRYVTPRRFSDALRVR